MCVQVECLIGKQCQKKPILFRVTEPASSIPYRTQAPSACAKRASYSDPPPVCVECLIGKQKKPMILVKVTESSSVPYRDPSACAKMAAYPDPPPVTVGPGPGGRVIVTRRKHVLREALRPRARPGGLCGLVCLSRTQTRERGGASEILRHAPGGTRESFRGRLLSQRGRN